MFSRVPVTVTLLYLGVETHTSHHTYCIVFETMHPNSGPKRPEKRRGEKERESLIIRVTPGSNAHRLRSLLRYSK